MYLCNKSPQLLNNDYGVELVKLLGGKVAKDGYTALILLFEGNTDKIDFGSDGFKLLWEREKNMNEGLLKHVIHNKLELKARLMAVLEAVAYYE